MNPPTDPTPNAAMDREIARWTDDDGVEITATYNRSASLRPPRGLTSIYARRFTRNHIDWLGDEIVDLLIAKSPDAPAECIGHRTNRPTAGTRRLQALLNAAGLGNGEELSLHGWPGLGDDDA